MTADYLRKQARTCLEWARECFDLGTSARLRLMAQDFAAKAAEIESAKYQIELEPRRAAAFEMRSDAS